MNKVELARNLASELGVSVRESKVMVEALVLVMGQALVQNESVVLSNFGTLRPVQKAPRSFGPRPVGRVVRPDSFQVRFKASDRLLEALKEGDNRVTFQKRPRELPRAS